MMNLFENLQIMQESSENITYKDVQKEINDLKKELKNKDIVEDFGQDEVKRLKDKYDWFNLTDVDSFERVKILKAIDSFDEWCKSYSKKNESNSKIKIESKDTLWTNFNRHYNGFIPLRDLTNYFSLDQFGEFIQWCRKEADLDYDYEKRYSDWSEIYQEINDIWSSEDVESISVENVFNYFKTSDLEEFWKWVEKEYDLVEDELNESTKVMVEKVKESDFVGTSSAIEVFRKLIGMQLSIRDICECFDSPELFLLYKFIIDKYGFYGDGRDGEEPDEYAIEEYMYEESKEVEEATSGISTGAYSTKAIDILPGGMKKIKESLYDEYLERVMDEKSNVELVNLLHEIRDNEKLKKDDKKKLEDEIRTKVRSIKTEAITEFYGKEWTDEEIQDRIEFTKNNLEDVANEKYTDIVNYENKDYYLISDAKDIVYDEKECLVRLGVDDNLNKYLIYFELVDDAYDSERLYKVVEV